MWSLETDPDYQADLDWADAFVRDEVEPLEFVIPHILDIHDPVCQELVLPLQARVKERGLWATHLGPDLGGKGYGQLKLALLNEVLGWCPILPIIFRCQALDTGNAEIIAYYGTQEYEQRYLQPLFKGQIFSSYSTTESQGGSEPIHRYHDYKRVRSDISAVKAVMPTVLKNIASRAKEVSKRAVPKDE
jgi:acyl-CoA dehydrogenase